MLNTPRARVAIVGAGLAGLYAAWRLAQQGVQDYVLLEARSRVGGRVLSVDDAGRLDGHRSSGYDRFDLGPTWFWPGAQRGLDVLVDTLGLRRFEQFEDGHMLVERAPWEAPARVRGYRSEPPSMRLQGSMTALVEALRAPLEDSRVLSQHTVHHLGVDDDGVELRCSSTASGGMTWRAEHVLLALPPRLAMDTIRFAPELPPDLARQCRSTATWMAPHAKYLAVYEMPFWHALGLSGEARSACGPLAEVHDASVPNGRAALFGFLGIPARVRRGVAVAELKAHCRQQLARLFGPQAHRPIGEALVDWAADPLTATEADLDASGQHPEAPAAGASAGPWHGRLTGIGSEWSVQFPGYLAGAVDAAEQGVKNCLASTSVPPSKARS